MSESGNERIVPRPLDWTLQDIEPGPTIFARYQQMVQIRRDHPVLRASNFYPSEWKDEWTRFDENGKVLTGIATWWFTTAWEWIQGTT